MGNQQALKREDVKRRIWTQRDAFVSMGPAVQSYGKAIARQKRRAEEVKREFNGIGG